MMGFRLSVNDQRSETLGATIYPSKDKLATQQQLKKANQKFIRNYQKRNQEIIRNYMLSL